MRCIRRDRTERYPDACALLAALESWHADPVKSDSHAESAKSAESVPARAPKAAPQDVARASEMARLALKTAREDGRLTEAADLMEEAFNLQPGLRDKHASRVKLWRAGVSM